MKKLFSNVCLWVVMMVPGFVDAGTSQPPIVQVDEPTMLPLMAVGAVMMWLLSKRKK